MSALPSAARPEDVLARAVGDAVQVLNGQLRRAGAADVPNAPGLYAIWADGAVTEQLGIGSQGRAAPIYIGKAERSLRDRDLRAHFGVDGAKVRSGSSTLRRSLSALLADELELRPVPRGKTASDASKGFSLHPEDEGRLSTWMQDRLELATWALPVGLGIRLGDVESRVIRHWDPPLNIVHAPTSRTALRAARAALRFRAHDTIP
ncbi:GIY-YIG nuclease family protein [Curtobacterium sp. MR_MD2014]|uniref:GIY-YIG nuclease family protein n=1 Tax=Curtobacterium sp. MR_MD2014 TaxID=1561023 RepID=UPI00052B033A|nr:hypothetical protein [Curtobacterium sp. MR_MD2014]AIV39850.1 hypothetical protein NI26_05850 [Curtobacterium sp. MR_MD2014]